MSKSEGPKYPQVHVHLVGQDSNAGAIMGRVTRALKRKGVTEEECNQFRMEAMSGDYNHLLQTVMKWVAHDDEDHPDYDR